VAQRYIPAWQIIEGKFARGSLAGQLVLVGATAQGLGEMHFSPLGDHVPAIEVLAQALEQAATGKSLVRAAWAPGAEMFVLIAGGLLVGAVALSAGALVSAGVTAALLAVLGLAAWFAFTQYGLLLEPVKPGLILIVAFLTGSVARHVASEREQRWVREAFSKYVSPSVVNQLIAAPDLLRLGGERREVTILFTDLAGFTTIAESLKSEQVATIINRHLSETTETIQRHGGTVDKFIGDGVMAFWGAPIADADQAVHAVRAAIDMQNELSAMRIQLQREMGVELHMRIGINRGECIVGNMGGKNHFNYTLMGDAVNLASRIEGVNKVYGTGILISDSVAAAVDGKIRLREIDTVRVKGKQAGTTLHVPSDDETLNAMTAGALAAYRAGEFGRSVELWQAIAGRYPQDPVASVFLARMARFKSVAVTDWDGITTLDEK
jgi:adenylate cyclase